MLINLHDCGLITTSVAVVGCTENGHHIPVLAPIVTLHDELMRSCHQCQTIVVIERLADVLTKGISRTSRTDTPSTPIIRITPQQVTHRPFMWHLLNPVQTPDIVQRIDTRTQSSVEAKDLVVNQGCERQVVKEIGKVFPHVRVAVFAQALVVEAVDLGDLARFMVAAEDGDAGRVADFKGDEESDCLDRVVAAVDVVTWKWRC